MSLKNKLRQPLGQIAIIPWHRDRDAVSATDPTGALMVGCTEALRTLVGTLLVVPTAVLKATGVTDPIKTVIVFVCLGRFFGRTSRERHCGIA